ncbi:hypothetical protein [Microbulbifer discodermiae]|uniref:hypothetical protein n=1 Tax=Microbulbifer sp. 2201CG32-9 TaxID=3232309 RepID=UPI00345C53B4
MKIKIPKTIAFSLISPLTFACNFETGEIEQFVRLKSKDTGFNTYWSATKEPNKFFELPDGTGLNIKIIPATSDKYKEMLEGPTSLAFIPELVKIEIEATSLHGESEKHSSWGGVSSIQEYSQIGTAGIELVLLKQGCAAEHY